MPIIKSAKKRVRVAHKAASRNRRTKRSLKTAVKSFAAKATNDTQRQAQSAIDVAVKKGVIHKNKAARQKKRLAAQAKVAGVKPAKIVVKKAVPAKKPVAKKPAAKKTPAKKK